MGDGIYAAMSGAVSRSRALDVVANNVANAGTPGFRSDSVAFREAPAQPAGEPARPDTDLRLATVDAVTPSWQPGPLEETGAPLDLAINGDGMFTVGTDAGVRYVRGGSMQLDASGRLVTTDGHPLLNLEGEPIQMPTDGEPSIGEDGTIMVGERQIDRLAMVWFDSPALLSREGGNLFSASAGAQPQPAPGTVEQGYIENSNINVVRGMVDLVSITRSYEATVRAMETFRTIDRRTVRDLARG